MYINQYQYWVNIGRETVGYEMHARLRVCCVCTYAAISLFRLCLADQSIDEQACRLRRTCLLHACTLPIWWPTPRCLSGYSRPAFQIFAMRGLSRLTDPPLIYQSRYAAFAHRFQTARTQRTQTPKTCQKVVWKTFYFFYYFLLLFSQMFSRYPLGISRISTLSRKIYRININAISVKSNENNVCKIIIPNKHLRLELCICWTRYANIICNNNIKLWHYEKVWVLN